LPAEEFDKVWPFVSSVYRAKQHRVIKNGTLKVSNMSVVYGSPGSHLLCGQWMTESKSNGGT
jgi:hypothetical protein